MTDMVKLLTPHLPAIRASAAIEYEYGPAQRLLANYDLWLKMRGDPREADYARGVEHALTAWQKAQNDKLT